MSIVVKVVSASWCSQCQPYKKELEKQGSKYINLDADEESNLELLKFVGVRSRPTTIIFKDGEVWDVVVGNKVSEIKQILEEIK